MGRFSDFVAQNPGASDRVRQLAAYLDAQDQPQEALPSPNVDWSARTTPQPTEGTWGDVGVSLAKGFVGAGQGLVGLADIPTLGRAGKALESAGVDLEGAQDWWSKQYSPYRQQLQRGLDETKGFLPSLGYMAQNPSTIGHAVVEAVPSVMAGGAIGRGAGLLKAITPAAAVGIGEGAISAGALAEGIRTQTEDRVLTPGQAAAATVGGVVTGAFGAAGARIAQRLGLPDVDTAAAGIVRKIGKQPGYLARIGGSMATEGALEELPQSMQEQFWQNVALGRPAGEGVPEAGARGLATGAAMGGGFAALRSGVDPNQVRTEDIAQAVDEGLGAVSPVAAAPAAPLALPAPSIVTDAGTLAEQLGRERAERVIREAQAPRLLPAPSIVTDEGTLAAQLGREHADQLTQAAQEVQKTVFGGRQPTNFANISTDALTRYLGIVERKAEAGTATSRDLNLMRMLRGELGSRADVEQEYFGRRQLGLFDQPQGLQLPARVEREVQAQQQRQQAMRDKVVQILGRKNQFTAKLKVESDEDLLVLLMQRLQSRNPTKSDMALADHFGLDMGLPERLQQLQTEQSALAQAAPTEDVQQQTQAVSAEIADIQAKLDLIDRAWARVQGEENAVQEPVTAAVDVRESAQDGGEVAARDTQAEAITEESQPEKVASTRWTPEDVVVEMRRVMEGVRTTNKQRAIEDGARSFAILMQAAQEHKTPRLAVNVFLKEHKDTPAGKRLISLAQGYFTRMNTTVRPKAEEQVKTEKPKRIAKKVEGPLSPDRASKNTRVWSEEDWANMQDNEAMESALGRNISEENDLQPSVARTNRGQQADVVRQNLREWMRNPARFDEIVRVVDTFADLPKSYQMKLRRRETDEGYVGAFVTDGRAWFVADRLPVGSEIPTLMHEVGVHLGFKGTLGEDKYQAVVDKINAWAAKNDGSAESDLAQRAHERLAFAQEASEDKYTPEQETDELIAYFVEEAVQAGYSPTTKGLLGVWLADLWSAFKSGLQRVFGVVPNDLTTKDVVTMAYGAAHMVFKYGQPRAILGVATSIREANAQTKQFAKAANDVFSQLMHTDPKALSSTVRRKMLGWMSVVHMDERYRQYMPQIAEYKRVHSERDATFSRISQLFIDHADLVYNELKAKSPKAAETVVKLMSATEFGVDPRKGWAEHTWLQDSDNKQNLRQIVETAHNQYSTLSPEGKKLYNNLAQLNNMMHYSQMAMGLYYRGGEEPSLQTQDVFAPKNDPMKGFRESAAAHKSPQAAMEYWKGVLESELAIVRSVVATGAKNEELRRKLSPLARQVGTVEESLKVMQQAPYFHLGRHGDFRVAFGIKQQENSKAVDPAAKEAVAKTLSDAGYSHATISSASADPRVFIRVDSETQMNDLVARLQAMKKEGIVVGDISSGLRDVTEQGVFLKPEWMKELEQSIIASTDIAEENKPKLVNKVRELGLDLMPDLALAKVLVHRESRPGYDANMWRNFAHRMQVGAVALSDLSSATPMQRAMTAMKSVVKEAEAVSAPQRVLLADLYNELKTRQANARNMPKQNFFDHLRAANYAFFLGMSPAYFIINLTQVPVILWPELSKRYGYVKAAKTIAKVTPVALKIMRQTFVEGKKLGWRRAADALITVNVLEKVPGLDKTTTEFLMRMIARGDIDIGNAARELGRVAETDQESGWSKASDTMLRYAAVTGYYSETLTRLIAALGAYELHGKNEMSDQYASDTVNNAMFNYSTWAVARQTGKMGLAGQLTPVMASFMTYQFQLTEKLYREVRDAFDMRAENEEERKAARRFLKAHLAVVTTLAGTLGMPLATVFAAAADKLCDALSDGEPCDVKASYRNFLADVFGKDVGELIAKGAPRAAGVDVAARIGEQDILPFSRFLSDKRAFEDSIKDQALGMWGSPVSMVSSIVSGGKQLMNGEVLQGLEQMMPVAIKGPVKAYRMTKEGYTDKAGNVLPMSVGAENVLAQVLGFNPSEKAEYSEANIAQKARAGQLRTEAGRIRKNLAKAYEQQDSDSFGDWYRKAQKFDEQHPERAILPGMARVLQQRQRARALAESLGRPIGVSQRDVSAGERTEYANY